MDKYVYTFGNGSAEGDAIQKNLLGWKSAGLAEMSRLGLPVPTGFTITTECYTDHFNSGGRYPTTLKDKVDKAISSIELSMGIKFGDPQNPLLVSCRSGARRSMPGMMETVLNVELTTQITLGMILLLKRLLL